MDMRPRMSMELRQDLLESVTLEHLPPEYKAKELRETIDLMKRVAKYNLVDLATKDKVLAKAMLDSKVEWNDSQGCYYVNNTSLRDNFNYNYLQYLAVKPESKRLSVRFTVPFEKDNLEDLLEGPIELETKKKGNVKTYFLCAEDDTRLVEARGHFLNLLVAPDNEHYDLALDALVNLTTKLHSEKQILSVPTVSLNKYLLGFFLKLPDFETNRNYVKEVLTNFNMCLKKDIHTVVLDGKNISADRFFHPAKKKGCYTVNSDVNPRHVNYFYCDEMGSLIVGFDAKLDKFLIKKKLEPPAQVSFDGKNYINMEELDYDKVTRLQIEGKVNVIKLPGTKLLRNTQYASADLEFAKDEDQRDIIRLKGSDIPLVYLNNITVSLNPALDAIDQSMAIEITNAIYSQLLLETPFVTRGKEKSALRNDEREVIKEIDRRADPYVHRVRGVDRDYARLLAQKDMYKETLQALDHLPAASENISLLEAAKRYKANLIDVLKAERQGMIKTDKDGNVSVQDFEKYFGGSQR